MDCRILFWSTIPAPGMIDAIVAENKKIPIPLMRLFILGLMLDLLGKLSFFAIKTSLSYT
jgi:hypothetical protein